jgi:hypothetical protein
MIGWGTDGLMHTPSAKEAGRNTLDAPNDVVINGSRANCLA